MHFDKEYINRKKRILDAVQLKKPDRIPVVLEYAAFAAHVTNTSISEFVSTPAKATDTMIRAYKLIGRGDAINYGSFSPYRLCYLYGAKVRVPGVELPPNEMWQVVETELMREEDYDLILEIGWTKFFEDFISQRVLNDAAADLLPGNQKSINVKGLWAKEGIPVLSGGDVTTPFEILCGSRSMNNFFLDLIEKPEKVEKAMELIVPHLALHECTQARDRGYPAAWVGGWRTAPCFVSPTMWDRFVWPYFYRLVNEVIDFGLIALLHLDSNWDRELERFKEFPKGKLIMALDGETDIFKAKEILGDHLCIMGDVPATMLAFDTPDNVYKYCKKLIRELGPEGFILHSGCDIPTNAKLENVQAMVESVLES
jgi:uroporphyrinogen-III decarboxylase